MLYARQVRANQGIDDTLHHLVNFLNNRNIESYVDQDTAESFNLDLPLFPRNKLETKTDLILVVGGDGSLLSAAKFAIKHNIPVIGINRGYLGFLTDISPTDFENQLTNVFSGIFKSEHRTLLKMRIHENEKTYVEGSALNDVVLSRGNETRLITFDVYINQQFVSHYRADGLILTTPTGSTAYAMSAGGPIMHPNLEALAIVPMFSHSLSSRPLVIDSNSIVELHISADNENDLQISCDGNESNFIKPGQIITIEKHPQKLHLLHPIDYHYYDTLKTKLGWGLRG
ncbi:MAG: NAD kinase [Legionellales bacterium RIFCSPHIGHO2_12_FULL_35_11]|nr:MAG: NAD kinase [Legionellales bacterium RIFCSPHIGHO2_12_FULL_35_11]